MEGGKVSHVPMGRCEGNKKRLSEGIRRIIHQGSIVMGDDGFQACCFLLFFPFEWNVILNVRPCLLGCFEFNKCTNQIRKAGVLGRWFISFE